MSSAGSATVQPSQKPLRPLLYIGAAFDILYLRQSHGSLVDIGVFKISVKLSRNTHISKNALEELESTLGIQLGVSKIESIFKVFKIP